MTRKTILTLLLFVFPAAAARVAAQRAGGRGAEAVRGRLEDVRGRNRVALLVSKALVLDARDPAATAFEDYARALAGTPPRLHVAGARQIADKLNKYIRKYRMMTAARNYEEADLVIVFKVTGQRPSAVPTDPYVWGKMYVLSVGADRVPRLVWESKDDTTAPEDATGAFLKALKAVRGEK
jgi:hypothetical protein